MAFNAVVNASNALYHDGVTHETPYPILHTLGADNYAGVISSAAAALTVTSITDGHNIVCDGLGSSSVEARWQADSAYVTGDIVKLTVTVTINSGTPTINAYNDGVSLINLDNDIVLHDGVNEISFAAKAGTDKFAPQLNGDETFDVDLTFSTLQNVTLPSASYFSYINANTGNLVQLSAGVDLPISTTYPVTVSHYGAKNHTVALTDAEIAQIEANHDLMNQVWFDGIVLVDGFSRATAMVDCDYFPANEGVVGGAFVQNLGVDLGDDETINGSFDTDTDWTKSTGWTITGGEAHSDGTQTGDSALFQNTLSNFSSGDYILVGFDINSISVNGIFARIGDSTPQNVGYTKTDAGKYSTILEWSGGGASFNIFAKAGTICSIDNVATKIVTAVEILNYTSNVRTNLLNQSVGASNLAVIQDGSGRSTALTPANTTQWKADGRTAVTGWTITAPFTITDIVNDETCTYLSNGNKYKNGSPDGTYTVPTGVWVLSDARFDGTVGVTKRGNTKMIDALQIP